MWGKRNGRPPFFFSLVFTGVRFVWSACCKGKVVALVHFDCCTCISVWLFPCDGDEDSAGCRWCARSFWQTGGFFSFIDVFRVADCVCFSFLQVDFFFGLSPLASHRAFFLFYPTLTKIWKSECVLKHTMDWS